jgi:hypothetical protein
MGSIEAGIDCLGKVSVCARRLLQQPAGPMQMWGAVPHLQQAGSPRDPWSAALWAAV